MTKSVAHFLELESSFGAPNYLPLDIILERGEGTWVWDILGNKYLDCLASYSALNQGHCHPKLIKAVEAQAKTLSLTSRAFRNTELPLLYEILHRFSGKDMFLLMNSGAEAVETAIKIARRWGYRSKGVEKDKAEIIVCENNFHGRTTTLISFSSEETYKKDFGPFTPGFKIIPFGDPLALEKAITKNTVAFLVEPIQAEAGVLIPPDSYLKSVESICKKANILLIADEIQTGLGRTGERFCFERESVKPDLITIGKALSGGYYPISAVLGDKHILELMEPGSHGSTFGGNPFGCAIAKQALNILSEEDLISKSKELGIYALEKFRKIDSPLIKDVRGMGLLIGIELNVSARSICLKLAREGILCKDTHDTVIRFTPPLVITKQEIDFAVEGFRKVLK
ncbi:ornithine--oxo-acid transaminase [Leptospira ilyithenensis]|uniref:ornithine aminotransferase n=1 Tax=Leptospira ilyithenensis TaxID=2484901 RepID=A0A4R9LTT0_9LEPT|nr:ornithine--oxo-acid transaminase [Leptospira ilyithenensis]TGN10573.1 ornithine--oxo-acid transaminase [Leptospira ilyithenensis]